MARQFRASTKSLLEPAMADLGFDVGYPHFRRREGDRLQVVSLVHDKWGGGFFLEFATLPAGELLTSWGERIPENKIDVAYTDPASRARLLATTKHSDERSNYFRYESFADDRAACDGLIMKVVSLLPQVLSWLVDGSVGPNIVAFSPEPPKTWQ